MAQKSLFDFAKKPKAKPKKAKPIPVSLEAPSVVILETEKKEMNTNRIEYPPIAPDDLPPSYFVSASYDGREKKAVIKLYEPKSEKIYFWLDNTKHKPYCLTNLSTSDLKKIPRLNHHQGFDHFEVIEKFDPLLDKNIQVTKIVANDPLAIGGRPQGSIRDIIPEDFPKFANRPIESKDIKVWESKIRYYQSYIYDKKLFPGMIYEVRNGNLREVTLEESEKSLNKIKGKFQDATPEELEHIEKWARLLEYPAPKFNRAAIDIEVLSSVSNRIPDPRRAAYPVICVSVYDSDNKKRVLILKRK
ncbi:hypothetical protein KAI11_04130, partial [Candidatus Bathyarchaeota archaeon]|nr:hypothetical protein [Candidatus Bathyarchaeota archaeon]